MTRITIEKSQHTDGTRLVMRGETLLATLSRAKPTRANGRQATYGVAWLSGRYDWHDTYSEARDNALKGPAHA